VGDRAANMIFKLLGAKVLFDEFSTPLALFFSFLRTIKTAKIKEQPYDHNVNAVQTNTPETLVA
jgi:hypothetical protein